MADFRLLSFAAIAPEDEVHTYTTPFGIERFVRREGEALHPDREPLEVLEEQRRLLGTRFFAAQYLQAPVPLEGGLVKRAWLRFYHPWEVLKPDRIIQSWDTAQKMGQLNDYSVCTTWAIIANRAYLLDVIREKLEFPALKRRVIDEADRWKAEIVLIEDKGSGTGLLQELRASFFGKVVGVEPKGDKGMRLGTVTPMIEEGRVYLPQSAIWLDDFIYELCGFPGLRNDDQVDSTSQFLAWLRDQGNPGNVYLFYQQEFERSRAMAEDRTCPMRAPPGVSHFQACGKFPEPVGMDGTLWMTELDARAARTGGWTDVG
jgi:predicted phage terminase large subunit-like protein